MTLSILKVVTLSFLLGFSTVAPDHLSTEEPEHSHSDSPQSCSEAPIVSDDQLCEVAVVTVTVNGVCKGWVNCSNHRDQAFWMPCCSDFGKVSGWCKETIEEQSN